MKTSGILKRVAIVACGGIAALWVTGCGGAKEQYFRLTAAGTAPLQASGVAVGIAPVSLPTYIDRAELVFQTGDNQFQVPTKTLWAGSLQENFTQVLATDLARHLGSGNVVANPRPGENHLRYIVTVSIQQFHAISGQGAVLNASWRVEDAENRQVLRHANGNFHATVNGDGYSPVVTAESDLVEQLSAAIRRTL